MYIMQTYCFRQSGKQGSSYLKITRGVQRFSDIANDSRRGSDDAAVDVIALIHCRENDVIGFTRPRDWSASAARGSSRHRTVVVAVHYRRRRPRRVVESRCNCPRVNFRRKLIDSTLTVAVDTVHRATPTADRKHVDEITGRKLVEQLTTAVWRGRRRSSTLSDVNGRHVVDVGRRAVHFFYVVGRRREIRRRTFTGVGGGGGGVQTGSVELA